MLPRPGVDDSRISPPSSRDNSRLIASPSPVPPYLRLVQPSACWNASKMICCLSDGMPMPVSDTAKQITSAARFSSSLSGVHPLRARLHASASPAPWCVNLNAFESRFLMICWSRLASV